MKYNISDLYFAKCRECIMDIENVLDCNGTIKASHPDYIDYYTILLFKNKEYINIFNKHVKYKNASQIFNNQEYYDAHLILEMHTLSDYIETEYRKVSEKECNLIASTIEKTKTLKSEYGYKK